MKKNIQMEIINIYQEQINDSIHNLPMHRKNEFFKEYYEFFNYMNNVEFDEEEINSYIQKSIIDMKLHYINELEEVSKVIIKKIEEKIEVIFEKINLNIDLGIILFIGTASIDGQGIIVDNKPYVFVDLAAVVPNINSYNLDAFIGHELIHPIHYALSREMYLLNNKNIEEKYFKRIIAEGVATYLSFTLNLCEEYEGYWLGYLAENEVEEWMENCIKEKASICKTLNTSLENNKIDDELYAKLFQIRGFENLKEYRTAYYYGAQIVKELVQLKSIEEVLKMSYKEWRQEVIEYFHK